MKHGDDVRATVDAKLTGEAFSIGNRTMCALAARQLVPCLLPYDSPIVSFIPSYLILLLVSKVIAVISFDF